MLGVISTLKWQAFTGTTCRTWGFSVCPEFFSHLIFVSHSTSLNRTTQILLFSVLKWFKKGMSFLFGADVCLYLMASLSLSTAVLALASSFLGCWWDWWRSSSWPEEIWRNYSVNRSTPKKSSRQDKCPTKKTFHVQNNLVIKKHLCIKAFYLFSSS